MDVLKLSNLIPLSEVLAEGALATSSNGSSLIFEQKPSLETACVEEQREGDDAVEYDDSDEWQNDGSSAAHLLKVLLWHLLLLLLQIVDGADIVMAPFEFFTKSKRSGVHVVLVVAETAALATIAFAAVGITALNDTAVVVIDAATGVSLGASGGKDDIFMALGTVAALIAAVVVVVIVAGAGAMLMSAGVGSPPVGSSCFATGALRLLGAEATVLTTLLLLLLSAGTSGGGVVGVAMILQPVEIFALALVSADLLGAGATGTGAGATFGMRF